MYSLIPFCLQVQSYCEIQDGVLLFLPASGLGYVYGNYHQLFSG